jgi:hypothetical protein
MNKIYSIKNQHQMMDRWWLFLSISATLDAASDDKDAVHLHLRPQLPPTDSDAPTTVAGADRAEDVATAAHPHLMWDVHPPSRLSQRGGHQGTWDYLRPQSENIMRRHPRHVMKQFANWNVCYSCGFDVAEEHTNQMCPQHLRKPDQDGHFTHQNVQQYIDAGCGCSTKNHHKTIFPQM